MTELVSPNQNPVIRKYLKDVQAWHGYIRFLGMPTLQTNPDVPIDELYVAQSLSLENLSTDKEPKPEQLHNPVKLLLEKHHLVILGDPGSGKSTLINWFAWQLASGFVDRLPTELSDLIPIPIVLRELKLDKVTTFEELLDAFLERPIAKNLKGNRDLLIKYCQAGNVLLLVDGLDEISLELRKKLLGAFGLFFLNFNSSFSIFTSRKVGYEDVRIGFLGVEGNDKSLAIKGTKKTSKVVELIGRAMINATSKLLPSGPAEVFIAPFTNKQINQFSLNWYRENLAGNEDGAKLLRDEFIRSIESNESTLQLARTPHLLTMMALIFKVRLQLPNGRAILYDLIAQAYLESIDTARNLKDQFIWQEKKRWLAKIAFEMQLQRSDNKSEERGKELLATKEQVLSWIITAMEDSYLSDSVDITGYANRYLDWIARRSGLLLPRGDNQFAFLHLSFQEYFAAFYIKQQIENPEYSDTELEPESLDHRFLNKPLLNWVSERNWQQVFIFLFELMTEKPGWVLKLFRECFEPDIFEVCMSFWQESDGDEFSAGYIPSQIDLFLFLLENPHVNFNSKSFNGVIDKLVSLGFEQQSVISKNVSVDYAGVLSETIISRLFKVSRLKSKVLQFLSGITNPAGFHLSNLTETDFVHFLSSVKSSDGVKKIYLIGSDIKDIEILLSFKNLESLCFFQCNISTIEGISELCELKEIDLFGNPLSDISELAGLKNLGLVDLRSTKVRDFHPLLNCKNIWRIGCSDISNVEFFTKFKKLEEFVVLRAPLLNDISPLFKLKKIKFISLMLTGVDKNQVDTSRKDIAFHII